jgi:hypothetical protein
VGGDRRSYYESFLIYLANRFNSAYYLLLIAGEWSGGETSGWLTLLGVWWKRAKLSGSEVHAAEAIPRWRTEESFLFLEYFLLHIVDATERSTGFFEGGSGRPERRSGMPENNSSRL